MRIVLSNIGTFGDINPLISIALELKRRGHVPVMALPNVYRPKIAPLGLEFRELRPDIDPTNTKLVEMIYDVKKGTETGLREFLYPVLRETYADLLDAATKPARADLLLLGELNYAGPIVAEVTGIPWASYLLAPFSFFSAFDPPVLPPYPKLARADKAPGMGRAMRRLARFVTRKWPEPVYALRRELGLPPGPNPIFDAKHSPNLVLALFSRVLGTEQKDWPANTLITGFCFYDADAGNAALPLKLEEFLAAGEPPVVFTLGSAAVLAAGDFYEQSARAAKRLGVRAVLLIGSDPRNDPRNRPQQELPDSICRGGVRALLGAVSARRAGGASGRRRHHGAMSPRRPAHAHHALLARPARQRAAHEPHGRGARHPALAIQAVARGAPGACHARRSGVCQECANRRRGSRPRKRRENRLRRAGSIARASEPTNLAASGATRFHCLSVWQAAEKLFRSSIEVSGHDFSRAEKAHRLGPKPLGALFRHH